MNQTLLLVTVDRNSPLIAHSSITHASPNRMSVLFSSKKSDWETPRDLLEKLNARFHFELDVCATPNNAKCDRFITPQVDALDDRIRWNGVCWMNPPYGRGIGEWIYKAYVESAPTVVCLLPARTDTKWFRDICLPYASEIQFLRGRVKFEGATSGAPFPSMIVVFGALPETNMDLKDYRNVRGGGP